MEATNRDSIPNAQSKPFEPQAFNNGALFKLTTRVVSFVLDIPPKSAQFGGRRLMIRNGKPIFFLDAETKKYANSIRVLGKPHAPTEVIQGPVEIFLRFILPRPQRLQRSNPDFLLWCSTRPDWDNLSKATIDGLSQCGFWNDDAQICRATVEKFYSEAGYNPRICVRIGAMEEL